MARCVEESLLSEGIPCPTHGSGTTGGKFNPSLAQTQAAVSTDLDQKAFPLLTNEFNTMNALTDKYLKITVD